MRGSMFCVASSEREGSVPLARNHYELAVAVRILLTLLRALVALLLILPVAILRTR